MYEGRGKHAVNLMVFQKWVCGEDTISVFSCSVKIFCTFTTILDQNLGACETTVHSSHMQRALPFFILLSKKNVNCTFIHLPEIQDTST